MDESLGPDQVRDMLINPFYTIVFDDAYFDSVIETSKEDWVNHNLKMVETLGRTTWLSALLEILADSTKATPHTGITPLGVVTIADNMHGAHEPLTTKDLWVKANSNMMDELGVDSWLWQFLEVLGSEK